MKRLAIVAVAAGFVVWAGTTAWAEDEGQDKAGDKGRHLGQRAGPFLQMDADKDGKITFEEYKAFVESKMQERFKKLDTNGDGVLTKEDRPKGEGVEQGKGRGQGKDRGHGKPKGTGETQGDNAAAPGV